MKINLWTVVIVLLACSAVYGQGPIYKVDQNVVLTVTFEARLSGPRDRLYHGRYVKASEESTANHLQEAAAFSDT